jgi:hypothetical protein
MRPSLSASAERDNSSRRVPPREARGDGARRIGDFWQWIGLNGEALGTSGIARRTLLHFVVVGARSTINIITIRHEQPQYGLAAPIIWDGLNWLTFILFRWIAWIAYRIAPLAARPRWKLLVHIPAAVPEWVVAIIVTPGRNHPVRAKKAPAGSGDVLISYRWHDFHVTFWQRQMKFQELVM